MLETDITLTEEVYQLREISALFPGSWTECQVPMGVHIRIMWIASSDCVLILASAYRPNHALNSDLFLVEQKCSLDYGWQDSLARQVFLVILTPP